MEKEFSADKIQLAKSQVSKLNDAVRFEALFNHASMGIVVANRDGIITAINPFALNEFGYNETEVIGKKVELLIPARYHHSHIGKREQFAEKPKSRAMGKGLELFGIKKNGVEFPLEVSLGNYSINNEQFIIAFINDISIRKKAEAEIINLNTQLEKTVQLRTKELTSTLEELQQSKTRLEEATLFQKAILDNAAVMIVVTNADGTIQFINPETAFNLRYKEEELVGRYTPYHFHLTEEIARKKNEIEKLFNIELEPGFEVLTEKAKRNIIEDEESYHYRRKDGTIFPVSLTVTAIRDKNYNITGYLSVAMDITARKQAEEDLLNSLQKEKELGELKSRFVSMASHEFRTPLSTILSSAYLAEKYISAEDQGKREKHFQRIISSVNVLTDILNDFLSVGKIEEGKIEVRLSTFELPKYIDNIVQELQTHVKNGQKIVYEHVGTKEVMLDTSMLKHIAMNLLTNAIKFSYENSEVNIKTIVSNDTITLAVKDRGIGISYEDQQHLMERFFRGTNATNIQGTGLGLHIVSKYVELMNGKITCISELEKGTEFIVIFNIKTNTDEDLITDRRQ